MRNRTFMDTMKYKLKEINKYLSEFDQRVEMNEITIDGTTLYEIRWFRPVDKYNEIEELVSTVDDLEAFSLFTGIEYGIRMRSYIYNTELNMK